MGPPPDEDSMLNMLENPQIQSSLNEALQNPAMIDMMIQQNPMLRDMGPGVRQMMESPEFRRMLTDPSQIRQMMQMQRAMGLGRPGAGGEAFPAPGVTNTTPEENRSAENTQNNTGAAPPAMPNPFMPAGLGAGNPFAALFGGNPNPAANPSEAGNTAGGDQSGAAQGAAGDATPGEGQNQQQNAQNPFSLLMNNPGMLGGAPQGQGGVNPFNPQQNPFLQNPAALSQMMQAMGGGGAGGAGAGGPGNAGAPDLNSLAALLGGGGGFGTPPPADNRPPEERYEQQLHQLNEMGFFEFERNIEALRRSGGSVQGAVEYLLSS